MYNKMKVTLTKKRTYELEPYGKFNISSARRPRNLEHIIPLSEINFDHSESMPFTEKQGNNIIKLMKKNKTEFLTDAYGTLYTRAGGGNFGSLVKVSHPKLTEYKNNKGFRELIDER